MVCALYGERRVLRSGQVLYDGAITDLDLSRGYGCVVGITKEEFLSFAAMHDLPVREYILGTDRSEKDPTGEA